MTGGQPAALLLLLTSALPLPATPCPALGVATHTVVTYSGWDCIAPHPFFPLVALDFPCTLHTHT